MTKLHIDGDYLVFENIECPTDSTCLFEGHKVLYVPRDILRDAEKSPLLMNAHQASVYCEQQGQFHPSFALTCSILRMVVHHVAANYDHRFREYLELYKTAGLHLQNTIVDFDCQSIIHNPKLGNSSGHLVYVNEGDTYTALRQRMELPFKKEESTPLDAGEILRCFLGGKRLKDTLHSTVLSPELASGIDGTDPFLLIVHFMRELTGLSGYDSLLNMTLGALGDTLSPNNFDQPHSTDLYVPKLLHGTYGTALGCDPVSGRFSVHVDIPGTALAVRGARNDRPSSLEDIK